MCANDDGDDHEPPRCCLAGFGAGRRETDRKLPDSLRDATP
jgi:hypothetical protein